MSRRTFRNFFLCAFAVLTALGSFGAGAQAKSVLPFFIANSKPTALDGDSLYWVKTRTAGKQRTQTVFQRSLTTGADRALFSRPGAAVTALDAGGGRVAFNVVAKVKGLPVTEIWSAAAADAAPTLVRSETLQRVIRTLKVRKHGKRVKRRYHSFCGTQVGLADVSDTGQILADTITLACKGTSAKIVVGVYEPNSTTQTQLSSGQTSVGLALGHSILVSTKLFEDVSIRNLATNTTSTFDAFGFASHAAIDTDGRVAVTAVSFGRKGVSNELRIIAPSGDLTTAKIALDPQTDSDLKFCGGSLLRVGIPRSSVASLTLYDYAGNQLARTPATAAKSYATARCSGRHVTVVNQAADGTPTLSEFDL